MYIPVGPLAIPGEGGSQVRAVQQDFERVDNHSTACNYHLVLGQVFTGNQNHLDKVIFSCCGGEQIGTRPVLHACKGCCTGKHMTREEYQVKEAFEAKVSTSPKWGAGTVTTPPAPGAAASKPAAAAPAAGG
eukprot:CAMPEP_0114144656 /NCGR_PEP_ID=MMETSP0043_2-20121206/19641_1 /TAXON_ID=464988 /ORGANISM="Hemiselmis andersenii, Strain CCMP644" /LENGTH=131 /DNA_ID=CAMNT_0001239045 /DNA_START=71 /DNA_END=463 /DNA_ORIENTATION=+